MKYYQQSIRNFGLEQRQNKNDSIQPKIIPILNLPRFFPHRLGGEKARQLNLELFLAEWSRSYIDLALGSFSIHFKVLHITEV